MKPLKQVRWRQAAWELWTQLDRDNVWNGAGALGFFLTLAIFPALIFLLSILPYLPIPRLESALMELLHEGLPKEAARLLEDTVRRLVRERQGELVSLGLLGTLWAASSGMYGTMRQLNVTYGVEEARSFVRGRAIALLLTLLFGVLVIGGFALVVAGGFVETWLGHSLGFGPALLWTFAALRWAIIVAFLLLGFALVYYLGPNVEQRFQWISPGSVFGVTMLIGASLLFRLYIEHLADYEATYGSIGAMVVLMLWMYVAGLVLLIGCEINEIAEEYVFDGKRRGQRTLPSSPR